MKNCEIYEYCGEGYRKLFNHRNWRVAVLNYIDELEPENIQYVEAHSQTDEVFVLLDGRCKLLFADANSGKIENMSSVSLEKNKVYKIPAGVFHSHTLSKDARLLIIEEENTNYENSPRIYLDNHGKDMLTKAFSEV